jgi:Zn-dependent M28 family amino/carboxypeptidase
MVRKSLAVLTVIVAVGALGACTRKPTPPAPAAPDFAAALQTKITADALMGHLTTLQKIADANGGNRAIGTPGYDASVDYVADALRGKGFDVQTPEFEVHLPFADTPSLSVAGRTVTAKPFEFTKGTPPQGVSGPLVSARVDDSPGCSAAEYDGLPVAGAVVLVDRGKCQFGVKQTVAAGRGAVALIVANNKDGDFGGTLGEKVDVTIPVISVTKAVGDELRAAPGQTTIKLNAGVRDERTRNVIAQTRTGSTDNVVMTGAHLDSVPAGPGIDDNGSGVAAVLETALQLGSSPPVANAVRFGFWGAEEIGLLGSGNYLQSLTLDQLKDIALYLNFDMLASPNPGYFTYDGDQSAEPKDNEGMPRVPEGSAGIERTFVAYLKGAGKPAEDFSFDGRSDHVEFTRVGVPAGGLFSGAEDKMSAEQAQRWDGQANEPFDPNYHKATDTLDHINRVAFEIDGGGVAYAVGLYAQDLGGGNGVPARGDRIRHALDS